MSTEDGKVPPEFLAILVADAHITPDELATQENSASPHSTLPFVPSETRGTPNSLEPTSRPTSTWVGTGRAVAIRRFIRPR